jgi:ABC-2 type transport system permease protein
MVASQAGFEARLLLRNGEQLLLTIVIPVLVLVLGAMVDLGLIDADAGGAAGRTDRLAFLAPGVLALAVLSTAFTGQAISTGFERRYGALKLLGASPLPRWGLLAGKTLAVLVVEAVQVALITIIALALGWAPRGTAFSVTVLLLVGTAAFSALGLLMAGTLRAEATLAAANLVYLLLLAGGGIFLPLERFPAAVRAGLEWLPSAALADGLRAVLQQGAALPGRPVLILLAWAVLAGALAARTFRWE